LPGRGAGWILDCLLMFLIVGSVGGEEIAGHILEIVEGAGAAAAADR
jgi:hypothetical protein